MLVLARRENEKILFPNLGVTVEILRIAGRSVRVGIQAPSQVRVLREEIADQPSDPLNLAAEKAPAMSLHRMRNHLHVASMGLHLVQKQLEQGLQDQAEATLRSLLKQFHSLDQQLDQQREKEARQTVHTLLVEDDRNESELLASYLRMYGFRVDTAIDGCDALDYLAANERPDVVLLDMHMPRCDGPATVSAIRNNPKYHGLKVFAVSGTDPDQMGVACGPSGVDRWFSKPLNPESLVAEMNRQLVTACELA